VTEELDDQTLAFAHEMFDLARGGQTGKLLGYVEAGLPINLTNDQGDTLLILAAYHNHPTTVRALVERGAEVERINDRGQTALGAAVFRESRESVLILLGAHANPAHGSPSAIELARFFDLPEMLTLLAV
jgi:ankyrin repeat protein